MVFLTDRKSEQLCLSPLHTIYGHAIKHMNRFRSLGRVTVLSSLYRSFSSRRHLGFQYSMATASRQQPHWEPPAPPNTDVPLPPLKIWNSLTRSKTPFIPIDWRNRRVTWYACGPTVYDDAHLGHARNYVSTDIVRRIMRDYFKYNVKFVMNITDVDDKVRCANVVNALAFHE